MLLAEFVTTAMLDADSQESSKLELVLIGYAEMALTNTCQKVKLRARLTGWLLLWTLHGRRM